MVVILRYGELVNNATNKEDKYHLRGYLPKWKLATYTEVDNQNKVNYQNGSYLPIRNLATKSGRQLLKMEIGNKKLKIGTKEGSWLKIMEVNYQMWKVPIKMEVPSHKWQITIKEGNW